MVQQIFQMGFPLRHIDCYEENKEIISGVIFDPIKNEMFMAHKGLGSYLNNLRIRVSNKSDIKNSMLVTGGPRHSNKTKEKIFNEYEKSQKVFMYR